MPAAVPTGDDHDDQCQPTPAPEDQQDQQDHGTAWRESLAAQVARSVRTEAASSVVLLLSIAAALLWANLGPASYEAFWGAQASVTVGPVRLGMDLRTWVSSGLMTLFFLVVGLEARRELDLGDLRERRGLIIPFVAGLVGLAVPVAIFLLINLLINDGGPGTRGWAVAMSTDTALALGLVSLLGRGLPGRLRTFLVTVFVVDDLVALLVIAFAYSSHVRALPLVIAAVAVGLFPLMRRVRRMPSVVYVMVGLVAWGALHFSGVDPIIAGLAIGLVAPAYTPVGDNLDQTSGIYREFREQPTPQTARTAGASLMRTLSPNERLLTLYEPWAAFLIVPLFALANAGVAVSPTTLASAFTSPITLGIVAGYVIGKPVAIVGVSWAMTSLSRRRLRPPVGWAAVLGGGPSPGWVSRSRCSSPRSPSAEKRWPRPRWGSSPPRSPPAC